MSESGDSDDTKTAASGPRTLGLKRTREAGHVRQNFSHGRSKSVVVERKRKRTVGGTAAAKTTGKVAKEEVKTEAPPVEEKPKEKPQDNKSSTGVLLRELTEDEKGARARALADARVADEETRRQEEVEAEKRAEDEKRLAAERAEEERLKAEEEALKKAEEEARMQAPVEASEQTAKADKSKDENVLEEMGGRVKRAREEEERPNKTAQRRSEARRREGKLTIAKALSDEERVRSLASVRRARERERRLARGETQPQHKISREVVLPEAITIQELANRMAERSVDVIKLLMKQGNMAQINDVIDADTAELIAEELGHTVKRVSEADVEEGLEGIVDKAESLEPRAPVVTVMGHVDHGKTSLLDALRETDVVAGEAGGITQHIGAYQVTLSSGGKITFVDTPGHEAFTAMRIRGAQVTDIVILVVAADDSVMPQTIEAINHARSAEVPIIIAINKIDKPDADPTRVKNDLLRHEIVTEDMGGDILAVEVSAMQKTNLDKLEEAILLQAELLELKANPERLADGVVIEARVDRGRGPVATVLVQRGTIRPGDVLVAGAEWGRVRALVNDRGESVEGAGPSIPIEVLGLNAAPQAGDSFVVVENEHRAREITEYRQRKRRDMRVGASSRVSLEQMFAQAQEGELKEAPFVLKGDAQGSIEAIVGAVEKLGTAEVAARVIHSGVGGITESDVTLASASKAPIIGFNVRANKQAREAADQGGVEIRYYSVIYDLVDDIRAALTGLLEPTLKENFVGNAEVLEVFNVSKVGKVAGARVSEGMMRRAASARLIRDDVVVYEGPLSSLKRFKDEVREVQSGQECGIGFENYQDIKAGDVIECFEVETIARTL